MARARAGQSHSFKMGLKVGPSGTMEFKNSYLQKRHSKSDIIFEKPGSISGSLSASLGL
jgi:hypothetical protein